MFHLHRRIGNYLIKEKLGEGSFASVWRAEHVILHKDVAIKIIEKKDIENRIGVTLFQRELAILKLIRHPFLAELFEVCEDEDNYFVVIEFASNGNLNDFLDKVGPLSESQARFYFNQLILSIEYLHNKIMVVHRDLKVENIMLDKCNNVKIIDFGLSNTFTKSRPNFNTACGSPAYMAPEIINNKPYSKEADIWSLGVVLYFLMVGELPFADDNVNNVFYKILNVEPKYPSYLSPQCTLLLEKMLTKNPAERITITKFKEHPWFSANKFNIMEEIIDGFNKDIDGDIIKNLVELGVDNNSLSQQLLAQEFSSQTAMYRILNKFCQYEKLVMSKHQESDINNNNYGTERRLIEAQRSFSQRTQQRCPTHVRQLAKQPCKNNTGLKPKVEGSRFKVKEKQVIIMGNVPMVCNPKPLTARRSSKPTTKFRSPLDI
ncbi:CAMK family protein kinase [Tritrichomonas foetus]|uniref:non-specific serine/threonine protein kinase n=1 Tax=Tritrichomonas foetus TaxID=1144522 RepID=A0A1J4JC34_9EUKA|nr:CAMK family protein kinase [Tritrichomonas foetus]|eukprot:OHS96762.1 CAMK family protein kinase [Tritrichomonas foetus]